MKRESFKGPKSLCRCGHTGDGDGSEHGGIVGHGACLAHNCFCEKFTWNGWTAEFQARLDARSGEV